MGFEQIRDLDPVLADIDALQEKITVAKKQKPDAYTRIMEGWAI